jgi:hypothetical protein
MMKITGARWNDVTSNFCVDFDDGITLIIDEQHQLSNMLSVGVDTYFFRKNKWPAGQNLNKRVKLAGEWVTKNKHRYKTKKKTR